MATNEVNGLLTVKDKDGNLYIVYPVTKLENISDLEIASASLDGLMSKADKEKLDEIEEGAQVNDVAGVKGNAESAYRKGNVNITPANIGLGNVNNTSDVSKPLSNAAKTEFLKINNELIDIGNSIGGHFNNKNNPHGLTKEQMGLGDVDNTSDANKPVSIAVQTALDSLEADKMSKAEQLTNEDLNKVTTEGFYYGADANACINKPSDVTHFGLHVVRGGLGSGHVVQILYCCNSKKSYIKYIDGNLIGNWCLISSLSADPVSGQVVIANGTAGGLKTSGFTIEKSVPADAKFTDTTYNFATNNMSGLMTAADKSKLDGVEKGAQKNTVTGIKGNAESSYRTGNINIIPANIGLGNVDNTSDANKPISTATQTALNSKANASDLAKYLPLTGGTVTGQISSNKTGGPWIAGRNNAMIAVKSVSESSFMPAVSVKTKNGSWQIGAYDIDELYFSFTKDTDFASGTNNSTAVKLNPTTGRIVGFNLTGNADTATKLQTARTINGVAFDGTQNISIDAVTAAQLKEVKNSVSDGKTKVANAITAKGVTTATNATFDTMADNISNIPTKSNFGNKWNIEPKINKSSWSITSIPWNRVLIGTNAGIYFYDFGSANSNLVCAKEDGGWHTFCVLDNGHILAGGTLGIYISRNNGESWEMCKDGSTRIRKITKGYNRIFAVGDDKVFFYSDNNGNTWATSPEIRIGGMYEAMCLAHNGRIIIGGSMYSEMGFIYSDDNGDTWKKSQEFAWDTSGDIRHFLVTSYYRIFAATAGYLLYSDTNGETWNKIKGFTGPFTGIAQTPTGRLLALTSTKLYYSDDGGMTWNLFDYSFTRASALEVVNRTTPMIVVGTTENPGKLHYSFNE